jgi:transcriptional regulator with XRE-family HTH domain
MSIADWNMPGTTNPDNMPVSMPKRALHRLGAVRRLQGVSRRAIARRLNVDISVVKQQEEETCDLPLSTLYKWQELLEVPVAELLVDASDPLSPPILRRAQMVRVMKTALSILERTNQVPIRRMAETLVEQLVELMPELRGISAWHAVGQRRRLDEYGRAAERRLSTDMFVDLMD